MDFEINEKDTKIPPGNSYLDFHLIFDVKMYFNRKARFFANGSTTSITSVNIYAGLVSREMVRIAFTYAALNGLDIMASEIQNA